MSQPSIRPATNEMTLSVRLTPALLGEVVQILLHAVRTGPETAGDAQEAGTDAESESAPRPASTADPPPNGHLPGLPALYSAETFYIGGPCRNGHSVDGTPVTIRYKSSHSCVECEHLRAAARRIQRGRQPAPAPPHSHQLSAVPPVEIPAETLTAAPEPACTRREAATERPLVMLLPIESTHGTRPELPSHLAQYAFLSPIPCTVAAHHYRDSSYVLRYLADETCVQCTATARQVAGD